MITAEPEPPRATGLLSRICGRPSHRRPPGRGRRAGCREPGRPGRIHPGPEGHLAADPRRGAPGARSPAPRPGCSTRPDPDPDLHLQLFRRPGRRQPDLQPGARPFRHWTTRCRGCPFCSLWLSGWTTTLPRLPGPEETPTLGTRKGIFGAVAVTGGVITSAGILLAAIFVVLGGLPVIALTETGVIVSRCGARRRTQQHHVPHRPAADARRHRVVDNSQEGDRSGAAHSRGRSLTPKPGSFRMAPTRRRASGRRGRRWPSAPGSLRQRRLSILGRTSCPTSRCWARSRRPPSPGGVRVRRTDLRLPRPALLRRRPAGCEERIFEHSAPSIQHSNHLAIDEQVVVVGSSNMDIRFPLDLELIQMVCDARLRLPDASGRERAPAGLRRAHPGRVGPTVQGLRPDRQPHPPQLGGAVSPGVRPRV